MASAAGGGILIKKAKRADFEISEHLGNYLRCVNEAGKLDLSTPRGLYILGMWQVSCMLETYAQSSFYEEIAKSRKRANLIRRVVGERGKSFPTEHCLEAIGASILYGIGDKYLDAWWMDEKYIPDEFNNYEFINA